MDDTDPLIDPERRGSLMGTFVQNIHNFLIGSSTSGFIPDATNRVTQELVTPKYLVVARIFSIWRKAFKIAAHSDQTVCRADCNSVL